MKKVYILLPLILSFLCTWAVAQEGFTLDTLVHDEFVKTHISQLTLASSIVSRNRETKEVVAITKVCADRYLKLTLPDGILCVGCKQKLCTNVDEWICAENLQNSDALLDASGNHHLIKNIEVVHEPNVLYALTVKDHVFCVEPYGLLVHNMIATLGASTLCLGAISISNPVIPVLGITLALSIVANMALDTWHNKRLVMNATLPESALLAERTYYQSRAQDLEKLKKELLRIKQELQAIKALCNPSAHSFTYLLLSKVKSTGQTQSHAWLTIAKDKELHLNAVQQKELRMLRQQDLLVREHEIIELQAALAVHSNELIAQVDACCADYRSNLPAWNSTYDDFQRGCLDTKAVGQLYACLLTQAYTLENITRRLQETCLVGDYYKRLPSKGSCIATSTTLIDTWQQRASCINLNTLWINEEKQLCDQHITSVEQYFRQRGGGNSLSSLKSNLIKTIEKHLGSCDANVLATATNKLEAVIQEAKAAALLPQQEADKKGEANKTKSVGDILTDAKIGEEKQDCKQFIKQGGYPEALKDFETLGPTGIKDISKNGQRGLTGVLPDGRKVNVRERSTNKRPTLEIQPHKNSSDKSIKIRYGTK